MPKSVWNAFVNWQTKERNRCTTNVSTLCLDDHQFREEEMKSVGELSKLCSEIVLTSLYLARIGRPDILLPVNKLARAITKWTRACDKRLARLISSTHFTSEYKQYCHVGNIAQPSSLWLFQDSDFAGDLEDSKSTSVRVLCIFGSHTFCSKMLDVQETDMCVTQLHRIRNYFSRCRFPHGRNRRAWSVGFGYSGVAPISYPRNSIKSQGNLWLKGTQSVTRSCLRSILNCRMLMLFLRTWILLIKELWFYIFKDNKAVIKMIIKGSRSPNPRHLSRTHKVVLDWLFDRINLDPKILISYFDSKNQLADILTKGHFTRDEWNHLLCSFNISFFSSWSCSEAMAKRQQEGGTRKESSPNEIWYR